PNPRLRSSGSAPANLTTYRRWLALLDSWAEPGDVLAPDRRGCPAGSASFSLAEVPDVRRGPSFGRGLRARCRKASGCRRASPSNASSRKIALRKSAFSNAPNMRPRQCRARAPDRNDRSRSTRRPADTPETPSGTPPADAYRSEEHTSELQSLTNL